MPNTVDGTKFRPGDKPKYLLDRYEVHSKKVVLTICRLDCSEKYKGYDKVIKAIPAVVKEVENAVYLIGGKGNDVPRIKGLIKEAGLENYVKLIGFVPEEELVDHYNFCDVFAMPSKKEGFGIVFLEALACSKPVIAGNKDGSGDAVLGGKVGVLVNPDSVEEISQSIINVLMRRVPKQLLDPSFLRDSILETYGFERFKKRVAELIGRMAQQ